MLQHAKMMIFVNRNLVAPNHAWLPVAVNVPGQRRPSLPNQPRPRVACPRAKTRFRFGSSVDDATGTSGREKRFAGILAAKKTSISRNSTWKDTRALGRESSLVPSSVPKKTSPNHNEDVRHSPCRYRPRRRPRLCRQRYYRWPVLPGKLVQSWLWCVICMLDINWSDAVVLPGALATNHLTPFRKITHTDTHLSSRTWTRTWAPTR